MTVSLVTPDASCDQPFEVVRHDVMCLVKRHAYELAVAVPHSPHAPADEAQPRLHVRMKQPCRAGGMHCWPFRPKRRLARRLVRPKRGVAVDGGSEDRPGLHSARSAVSPRRACKARPSS
jgi:hypothetical protein